jgi:hypothetical protein
MPLEGNYHDLLFKTLSFRRFLVGIATQYQYPVMTVILILVLAFFASPCYFHVLQLLFIVYVGQIFIFWKLVSLYLSAYYMFCADHSGREVYGMECFRPLKH